MYFGMVIGSKCCINPLTRKFIMAAWETTTMFSHIAIIGRQSWIDATEIGLRCSPQPEDDRAELQFHDQ
jgi:hypothetical protein